MVGRSTILSRAGPEAHRLISEHWASKGVTCVFNEEMLPLKPGDTHFQTIKGTKVRIRVRANPNPNPNPLTLTLTP